MHLQYARRLIKDLEGDDVVRRNPQSTETVIPPIDGALSGPVTITVVQTLPGTASAPSPTTVDTRLGLPTVSNAGTSIASSTPIATPPSSIASSTQPTSSSEPSSPAFTTVLGTSAINFSSSTPSQTSDGANTGGQRSSNKLSSGGIAAIVFAMVIVVFLAVFFLMRRRTQGRRQQRRKFWSQSNPSPPIMSMATSPVTASSPLVRSGSGYARTMASTDNAPGSTITFVDNQRRHVPALLTVRNGAPTPSISVPPTSYNNSNVDGATFVSVSSAQSARGASASPAPGTGIGTVICTYITNLPDELPIKIGETIRVVAEYDDGWGLCTNLSGEQGMVPLECLQMGSTTKRPVGSEYDARRSRRASSLMLQ